MDFEMKKKPEWDVSDDGDYGAAEMTAFEE